MENPKQVCPSDNELLWSYGKCQKMRMPNFGRPYTPNPKLRALCQEAVDQTPPQRSSCSPRGLRWQKRCVRTCDSVFRAGDQLGVSKNSRESFAGPQCKDYRKVGSPSGFPYLEATKYVMSMNGSSKNIIKNNTEF